MPVETQHPDYRKALPDVEKVEDCLAGEHCIKSKREKYLPVPGGMKQEYLTKKSEGAYLDYLARAQFPDFPIDSLNAMVGLAFKKPPAVELPSAMEYLNKAATPDNEGLHSFARKVVRNALKGGTYGILVDSSLTGGQPYLCGYRQSNIINWIENTGEGSLSLAVLQESYVEDESDEFEPKYATQYRVLRLADGRYSIQIYKKSADNAGEVIEDEIFPTLSRNGDRFKSIPLFFAGSTDVQAGTHPIPMLGLCQHALKYYELSADYYHDLHQNSISQIVATGVDEKELPGVIGGGIWAFEQPEAKVDYLKKGSHADENRIALQDSRAAGMLSGAKVLDSGQPESGEARGKRQDDQQATLHGVVAHAGEAIESALKAIAFWMGLNEDEVSFKPNLDFSTKDVDSAILEAMIKAKAIDILPAVAVQKAFAEAGATEMTPEEMDEARESERDLDFSDASEPRDI